MICRICGEEFSDIFDHLDSISHEGKMDGVHQKAENEISVDVSKGCFCGGKIVTHSLGEDSWEISCVECGFLWGED